MTGPIPNNPRLLRRALDAYAKQAGPDGTRADPRRCFHAKAPDGRDFMIIRDRQGETLIAYVVRGDGRLRQARQLPPDLPEAADSRITETAPGRYASAVRLSNGRWLQSAATYTDPADAHAWARETAAADGTAVADRGDVRPPRDDPPGEVYVQPVQVPRYAAALRWADGRWWQCGHGHVTPDEAHACAQHAASDPDAVPAPPRPPQRGPNGLIRNPGRPLIIGVSA